METMSVELREGIAAWRRLRDSLGGPGALLEAEVVARDAPPRKCACGADCACPVQRRPTRTVRGTLSGPDCQAILTDADGRRWHVDLRTARSAR